MEKNWQIIRCTTLSIILLYNVNVFILFKNTFKDWLKKQIDTMISFVSGDYNIAHGYIVCEVSFPTLSDLHGEKCKCVKVTTISLFWLIIVWDVSIFKYILKLAVIYCNILPIYNMFVRKVSFQKRCRNIEYFFIELKNYIRIIYSLSVWLMVGPNLCIICVESWITQTSNITYNVQCLQIH